MKIKTGRSLSSFFQGPTASKQQTMLRHRQSDIRARISSIQPRGLLTIVLGESHRWLRSKHMIQMWSRCVPDPSLVYLMHVLTDIHPNIVLQWRNHTNCSASQKACPCRNVASDWRLGIWWQSSKRMRTKSPLMERIGLVTEKRT